MKRVTCICILSSQPSFDVFPVVYRSRVLIEIIYNMCSVLAQHVNTAHCQLLCCLSSTCCSSSTGLSLSFELIQVFKPEGEVCQTLLDLVPLHYLLIFTNWHFIISRSCLRAADTPFHELCIWKRCIVTVLCTVRVVALTEKRLVRVNQSFI